MSEGEDRHFCARADNLHIKMYADAWPDIYHAYHVQEYPKIHERLAELERPRQEQANFGDLVSARVKVLEPVPDVNGRMHKLGAKWIRGRLGALNVMPEVEEALGSMRVGDHKLIKIHYPAHYKLAFLRSQTRIVRVSLFDAKPFRIAPTIDREMFAGERSKRTIDMTTLTGDQCDDLARGARADDQ